MKNWKNAILVPSSNLQVRFQEIKLGVGNTEKYRASENYS